MILWLIYSSIKKKRKLLSHVSRQEATPPMLLLQHSANTRFGNFATGKNWGGYSHGFPVILRICPHQAASRLPQAGSVASVLGKAFSPLWSSIDSLPPCDTSSTCPVSPKETASWSRLSFLTLWYCLYIMIICSMTSFGVILHVPFHVDERPCPFHTFPCIDGSGAYKYCHHDLISF